MAPNSNPHELCSHQQIALVVAIILILTTISVSTSLNGKHLNIIPTQLVIYMEIKVNSTGHVIETSGIVPKMLDWLSDRFHFKFSYLQSVAFLTVDGAPSKRGKLSYLKNNEADLIVGAIVMTSQRFEQADFSMPIYWTSMAVAVPSPKSTTSASALLHPWQFEVWVGVVLALPIFILCLFGLGKFYSKYIRKLTTQQQTGNSNDLSFGSIINYVFEVILSQGAYLRNNLLFFRIATAAWGLACFILVQSYSCTLTSFLTVPHFTKPIINSIYDVPKVKSLRVVTDRGLAADNLFSTTDEGVFKQFGKMLKNNPELRCNKSELCVGRVKSGSHVYVGIAPHLDMVIQADYKKDGICHLTLLDERFLSSLLGFAIAKKSGYLEEINRGIEELVEYGFLHHWAQKHVVPKKELCHFKTRQPAADKSRLSLTNLTSAFALLFCGYLLSIFVFLVEKIVHCSRGW